MQAVPLPFLSPGTGAVVTEIRSGSGMESRLLAMGICPDRTLTIVSADKGSLIVSVAGSRYALSKGIAMQILAGSRPKGGTP